MPSAPQHLSSHHVVASLPAWPSWPGLAASVFEGVLDAAWLVEAPGLGIVAANSAALALLRADASQVRGKDVRELCAAAEDLCFWDEVASGLTDGIESHSLVRRLDGSTVPVLRRICRVGAAAPGSAESLYFMVVVRDHSEQRRVELELEDRVSELNATLESTADGILVTDLDGRIRNFNRRFAELWALPQEMLAQGDDDAVFGWMRRSVVNPGDYMRRLAAIDDATALRGSDTLTLHSGVVLERVTQPQCSRGQAIGRVYSFRDLSEHVESSRRIDTLSCTDGLTGLANRRVLNERIDFLLALGRREDTPFALLFLNLDRFKHINDTLGHEVGDRVLVEVAARLTSCMRQVDMVARLGADEFVLLVHAADTAGAEAAAQRVIETMQGPFALGGANFTVTCSVGIGLYPDDGDCSEDLLRRADAAMRSVQAGGRATYRFYRQQPGGADVGLRWRMKLDHAMRRALAEGHFRLNFQPQVELATGRVVGAEALIRWRDPELGDVAPGEFIPVAEQSGFIVAIGDWVLQQAVRQAALWRTAGLELVTSVNVSAVQFQQPGFVDGVLQALRDAGLPPHLLELEMTESILVQHADEALRRLQALNHLGVRLAIDDFGTGYSSLAYLKRFPIRRLKIDRSFINGLPDDESDVAIVDAIINLGRALHLEVIAEGVETEAQRAFLQRVGCDQYQGFLFAPALDVAVFAQRVAPYQASR